MILIVTIEAGVDRGDKGEGEVEQIVDHVREAQIQAVVLQAVVQLRGVKNSELGGNVMFYYNPYHCEFNFNQEIELLPKICRKCC